MYEQYMNQFNPGGYFPQPFSQPAWSYQRVMPQGITNVRGVKNLSEARNCTTPFGRTLLMNTEEPIFYIKETDFNNVSTIKAFSFQEYQPSDSAGQSNYITREEFDKWKERYESSIQPSTTTSSAANGSASTVYENNNSATGESSSGADATERFSF